MLMAPKLVDLVDFLQPLRGDPQCAASSSDLALIANERSPELAADEEEVRLKAAEPKMIR
jgi:hypothetical protein